MIAVQLNLESWFFKSIFALLWNNTEDVRHKRTEPETLELQWQKVLLLTTVPTVYSFRLQVGVRMTQFCKIWRVWKNFVFRKF